DDPPADGPPAAPSRAGLADGSGGRTGRAAALRRHGHMERDEERVARVRQALEANGLDAVMCTLAANVRLVSGYWPVIGNAVAITTREGAVGVVAPEDELSLANTGWADVVRSFRPAPLDALTTTVEAVSCPLAELATRLGIGNGAVLGIEE